MSTIPVRNPYDQSVVCQWPLDTHESLAKKANAAQIAYERWRRVPLDQRIKQVQEGLKRFREKAADTARNISLQMGKPLAQAQREVETFFERADYMVSIAHQTLTPEILPHKDDFLRRIEHRPLGIVLNIAAWNYPLLIPVNVVVPALLAGNAVLLKHSALTPLCGTAFEEAFGHLEVPNLVTAICASHEDTARLMQDPRVRHVAFTGSGAGGRQIAQQAAARLIDTGLELGGKDPAYVAEDADLDFAVANIVDGACYNAGQSCCSVERVYVHQRHYDAFLKIAQELMAGYKLGDPLKNETTMGPLAQSSALTRLETNVAQARAQGARVLCGGARLPNSSGNFFVPTLVAESPQKSALMQEESFGPILPVRAVANDQEALALMNDSSLGLTASVWTQDSDHAELLTRELDFGTVYQNRCDYLDPALPWSGARDSGIGSTLSHFGFYGLTRRQSIHFRRNTKEGAC
jgi:acyl-CoA reductase-like NAD-dependent aldehyde dehydrogenase